MKLQTNVKAGFRDFSGGVGNNVVNNTVNVGSSVTINDNSVNTPPTPPV
jgi:hypothetical protein